MMPSTRTSKPRMRMRRTSELTQAKYHCDCGWAGILPPPSEYRRLMGHAVICPKCGGYPYFEEVVQVKTEIEEKPEGKPVLFSLGQTLMTPGTIAAFERTGERPLSFLGLHQRGIWGQLSKDDREENRLSLEKGWRLMSAYFLKDGTRIWVITEADRASTTIHLPSEY